MSSRVKYIKWFAFFTLAAVLLSGCSQYYKGPESDHFNGRTFYNPGSPMEKGFGSFLKWRFTADAQPWPPYRELSQYDRPPQRVTGSVLRCSFIGHASVLLQTRGLNILTDPVWSERTSPVSWAGPKRIHPPGIRLEDLPPIDIVLISHNHYDHLDLDTIGLLWEKHQPRIIVPLGNDAIIRDHDPSIVTEAYDWGESVGVAERIAVHLEPMQHWSARGVFDRNKALWAAFIIATPDGNIYFAGDSGYGDGSNFNKAREKFGSFRLAILPIGSYDPRWFMAYGHMNPDESVRALMHLGLPQMLPLHYGTFQLADTGFEEPLAALEEAIRKHRIPDGMIKPVMPGESWIVR